jgi:hypothetical protein
VLVERAKKVATDKKKVAKLLRETAPARDLAGDGCWYSQAFHQEKRLVGSLYYDICTHYIPRDIRRYMAKTTMMQIRLPVGLHKWFRRYTQQVETTMTQVITDYLEYLRTKHKKTIDVEQI